MEDRYIKERERTRIPDPYKWDLTEICPDDDAWAEAKRKLTADLSRITAFIGRLAESPTIESDPPQTQQCPDPPGVPIQSQLDSALRPSRSAACPARSVATFRYAVLGPRRQLAFCVAVPTGIPSVGVRVGVPVPVAVCVGRVIAVVITGVHVTPGVAVPTETGLPATGAVASRGGEAERCWGARQAR